MNSILFLVKKISIFLAIAGILAGIFLMRELGKPDPEPQPVAMPAANPFINSIAASGIIESIDRNISIGTPVAGLVKNVFVKVGDSVQEGQVLFTMDDRDLQAQYIVEKANIEVAKANVLRLQDQFDRLNSIEDPRAVSIDEVKTRKNDVLISEAQLRAAEALAKQTELLLERLQVRAPRDGMILQNNIRVGEFLALNSSPPPILLGNTQLQVRADIDEQNASHFDVHQIAFAYPKNNTTLKIPLHFERIEPYIIPKKSLTGYSEERVDTRVLQVLYTFEPPNDFHVYVGQQVDVFIEREKSNPQ